MTLNQIDSTRKEILKQYHAGTSFSVLANRYTMDGSKDGDLGWFTEGTMIKEFENEVARHSLNDIFTVDIPEKNWYYVVLKTFDDAIIDECKILRIKSGT